MSKKQNSSLTAMKPTSRDKSSYMQNRLKFLRICAGYEINEMSIYFDRSASWLLKAEAGLAHLPADVIIKACDLYNISSDYILCISDDPKAYVKESRYRYSYVQKNGKHYSASVDKARLMEGHWKKEGHPPASLSQVLKKLGLVDKTYDCKASTDPKVRPMRPLLPRYKEQEEKT